VIPIHVEASVNSVPLLLRNSSWAHLVAPVCSTVAAPSWTAIPRPAPRVAPTTNATLPAS